MIVPILYIPNDVAYHLGYRIDVHSRATLWLVAQAATGFSFERQKKQKALKVKGQ